MANILDAVDVAIFLGRPETLHDPDQRAAARALLPLDELARVERLVFERDRLIALASRALQRRALSRCAPVAPADWRFTTDAHGRPAAVAAQAGALAFNVANTRGLVVCAVTRGREIGVDVERLREEVPYELVDAYFAPAEVAALRTLPALAQPLRFAELWTLKEAYLKARGIGLTLGIARCRFDFTSGTPTLGLDPALADDASTWQLASWSPTPEHRAALCVRRAEGPPLRIAMVWDAADASGRVEML